ncbi:MAG: LEA type 2 family protein [Candidatus Aminicenantes bacterium]|nr:MAG: LEA type 2 family protein [Candidatus Aminicenantes bacterium]
MKLRKISILLALFCILSGLALSKSLQDDVKISLKETRIKDFSMAGLSYVFYVNIANSSSSAYYLSGYDYRFLVNQKEYFRLQRSLDKKIEIEPRKSKLLSFPIKITFAHLFRLVKGIEGEGNLEGNWTGTMSFSDAKKDRGRLLFDFSGEFPVIKELEFKFLSLQLKDLTIGGADTRFETSLVNLNIFDVRIEKISYKFYLRDNLISEETVSGGKTIVSRGEQSYSFPMLINFFEVGKDVYTMLQMTSSLCRFTGEIEVRTEWGRVKIPFDQGGRVTIARTS